MDKVKAKENIRRGDLAKQVLDNPIYQEAFMLLRAQLVEQFTNTKFRQKDEREEIWRRMQTIEWVQRHFEQVMQTGKLEKESVKLWEKLGL